MALISQEVIQDILQRIDIVELIGEHVELKRTGQNSKGFCPFHNEKSPSFHVNPDRQMYYCFGCNVGGDAINFLMRYDSITFLEAMERLAERAGIELPCDDEGDSSQRDQYKRLASMMCAAAMYFHKMLLHPTIGQKVRDYLKQRQLNEKVIREFQLGFVPTGGQNLLKAAQKSGVNVEDLLLGGLVLKNDSGQVYDRFRDRFMIPITDMHGKVIAFGGRARGETRPKYLNSPETPLFNKSRVLFGLDKAKKEIMRRRTVIVVEGYMDCIRMVQEGFPHVVATLGTSLTAQHASILKRFADNVIIIYDSDKAGQMAALRGIDVLLEAALRVDVVALKGAKDPDDFLGSFGSDAMNQKIEQKKHDFFDFKYHVLLKSFGQVSPEVGKAKVADQLFESLLKIENHIVQGEYLKKLSDLMGVDVSFVQAEFAKKQRRGQRVVRLADHLQKSANHEKMLEPAERNVLVLLLRNERYFQWLLQNQEEFAIQWHHKGIPHVMALWKKYRYSSGADILMHTEDEELKTLITALAMDESIASDVEDKVFGDCIRQIVVKQLDKKVQNLSQEMMQNHRLEMTQDEANLWSNECKVELQSLIQKKYKINQEGVLL